MKDLALVLASIVLAVCGQLLLKQGMLKIGYVELDGKVILSFLVKAATSPFVIGGLISFGVSFVLWLLILTRLELSKVYPMVAVGYVLTVFFSWLFFKENVTALRIVAISLIVLGVVVLSRS